MNIIENVYAMLALYFTAGVRQYNIVGALEKSIMNC